MSKTHFDSSLDLPSATHTMLVASVPLHKTTYAQGVNGLEATNHPEGVDCQICLRKMAQ